jgi:hypothetical protein
MTRGLRIDFRFVPFPQEIWREGLDLTESEFKLLGYLLYHQARFGQSIIALSDDEMLNGRRHNGERVDRGCGIKGRNNLKTARQKLIERGWLDCEQDRMGTKYKIQLCEVLEEVSKLDTGVSKSDTPEGIQNGQSKRPKQTPQTSKSDTPNKEEEELYIEPNKNQGFSLPGWMQPYHKSWDGFLEMRTKIRASVTDHGKRLLVDKLEKFAARGHPPDEILDRSTEHSWRGLFEPKENGNGKQQGNHRTQETADAVAAGVSDFLRGKNAVDGRHVPSAAPAEPGD